MPDLQPFNSGETATSIRTKINAAIQRINTLDDANEIIAKIDTELGSTSWKNSVLTTDTLATLAATDVGGVANDTVIIVYGGSSAGDGEGGSYYWDQGSVLAHNSPTVIAPDSGDNGRWIKIQTALSGVDIKGEIIEEPTFDNSLADIGAIKDWVEQNSSVSDLEYVGITSYDGDPTVTDVLGTVTKVSDLEFKTKLAVSTTEIEYDVSSFRNVNNEELNDIRFVHITADVTNQGTVTGITEVTTIKVTYPDGTVVDVLGTTTWGNTDLGTTLSGTFVIPVNSDTSKFTITMSMPVFDANEAASFKIVGATTMSNASGFLGSQVYGGSGLRYSGATVFEFDPDGNAPTAYTDLNLRQYTDKGGRHLVFLKVDGDAAYEFKTNGESEDGGGTGASSNATGDVSYISVITDGDTLIEWKADSAAATTITLQAFQPLDDAPVVTRHYLGDIEFINEVNIVTTLDDIRNDTGWQTVQPNIAWAGASTLLVHCTTRDNDFDTESNYLKFRASSADATEVLDGGKNNNGGRDSQMLIPVDSSGSFQWRYYGSNSKLESIRVVGYISGSPLSNASYPYWNVTVDQRGNLTTVEEFTNSEQDTLATFREPSYGSVVNPQNATSAPSVNSLLYSMQVNVLEDTVINMSLFNVDDEVYIIAPDNVGSDEVKFSRTSSIYDDPSNPLAVSFTLYSGLQTIYIVKNDALAGTNKIDLRGDIIGDKVLFVGFSGTTGILDTLNGTVGHETVPTSQAVTEYAQGESLLEENGYQVLPSGMIMQWGTEVLSSVGGQTFDFPLEFPNACFNIIGNAMGNDSNVNLGITSFTKTTVTTNPGYGATFQWQAIGH